MHYCVFVMIDPDTDIETGVQEALAPFDEELEVEPYRVHFSHGEVRMMAEHYRIDPADLHALVRKMPDWTRREGGVDRFGLYYSTTSNPDGRWDWYEIGGRWNGYIPRAANNNILAGILAKARHLRDCLPCFVLTPKGRWLERERYYVSKESKRVKQEKLNDRQWLKRVREVLLEWPNCRVVCVDIHC
jgi:hypothetical protein